MSSTDPLSQLVLGLKKLNGDITSASATGGNGMDAIVGRDLTAFGKVCSRREMFLSLSSLHPCWQRFRFGRRTGSLFRRQDAECPGLRERSEIVHQAYCGQEKGPRRGDCPQDGLYLEVLFDHPAVPLHCGVRSCKLQAGNNLACTY